MPSKPPSRHRLDQRHALAAPVADGGDHDALERTFILPFDPGGVHRREQLFATERKRGKRDIHGELRLEAMPENAARCSHRHVGQGCEPARSSPVAGCAPVAPEITAMSAGAGGGKSRCHIRASAAVIAPAGRLERSDNTPDSRASGLALRASAWPRASRTRNAPSEPSNMCPPAS